MNRHLPNPLPALLVLALAYFTLGTAALAVIGLSLPISQTFHRTPSDTGLLVTVFALTFAAAALLTQSLFGHWPRKRLLTLGLTLLALGLTVGALTPTFEALLLTRVLVAIGAAMIGPVASATASQLADPTRQAQALATVFAGFTFSSVLGVPLASLLGPILGWRGTLLALAALAVLVALLVHTIVPAVAGGARVTSELYRRTLATPGVRPALLGTLTQIAAPFVVYGVAASYLAARFGSTPAWISATLLAFGVAGVLGNSLAGLLTARSTFHRTLDVSLIGGTIVALALFALPSTPSVGLLAFAAMSLFAQMFQTPQQARLIHLGPQQRGLMLALNASVVYLGISLGSALGSTLLPHLGARPLALLSLALMLVALVASRRVSSARRPIPPADPLSTPPHTTPTPFTTASTPPIATPTPTSTGSSTWQVGRHDSMPDRDLLADLGVGLARGEVVLQWQPRVHLTDGHVLAVEALARWHHPTRGPIPPDVFIPLAEDSGLIHDLGRTVLRQACAQGRAWADADTPVTVAVNVSAAELTRDTFVQDLRDILTQTGLPAPLLEVEITESTAIQDIHVTAERLRALTALGVSVAIDDFGSGYTSLRSLRLLPAQVLKIDRTFVRGLSSDTTGIDASIVRALVTLAQGVHMRVVAEGVETHEQRLVLLAIGCEEAQGYLFARPQSATDVTAMLRPATATHATEPCP